MHAAIAQFKFLKKGIIHNNNFDHNIRKKIYWTNYTQRIDNHKVLLIRATCTESIPQLDFFVFRSVVILFVVVTDCFCFQIK